MTEVIIVGTAVTIISAVALGFFVALGWAQYTQDRDDFTNSQKKEDQ